MLDQSDEPSRQPFLDMSNGPQVLQARVDGKGDSEEEGKSVLATSTEFVYILDFYTVRGVRVQEG